MQSNILLVNNNKGGEEGLIYFLPLKREGLLERGGLIEDLCYLKYLIILLSF